MKISKHLLNPLNKWKSSNKVFYRRRIKSISRRRRKVFKQECSRNRKLDTETKSLQNMRRPF